MTDQPWIELFNQFDNEKKNTTYHKSMTSGPMRTVWPSMDLTSSLVGAMRLPALESRTSRSSPNSTCWISFKSPKTLLCLALFDAYFLKYCEEHGVKVSYNGLKLLFVRWKNTSDYWSCIFMVTVVLTVMFSKTFHSMKTRCEHAWISKLRKTGSQLLFSSIVNVMINI